MNVLKWWAARGTSYENEVRSIQVTVNRKGELVLPHKAVRLPPGTRVKVGFNGRSVVITPVKSAFVAALMEATDKTLRENQPIFGVPAREYVRMTDEERDRLWEEAERKANR
jgi:hypothetical protein